MVTQTCLSCVYIEKDSGDRTFVTHTEGATDAPAAQEPAGRAQAIVSILRDITRGGLAGALAGIVVLGVGGRLAMRLSAVVDPDAAGRLTEGGNRVGEITLAGTIELIVFGGLLGGIVAAVFWVIAHPWIRPGRLEWLRTGLVAMVLGAPFLIDAENPDFFILGPAWFNVGLFLALLFAFGAVLPGIDQRLDARLPDDVSIGPVVTYALMASLGAPFVVPAFGSLLSSSFCFCTSPPRAIGVLLLLTATASGLRWLYLTMARAVPSWVSLIGRASLAGAVIAATFHLVGAIAAIL